MAKEKTQVDVELARIKAELERARIAADLENEKSKDRSATVRWGLSLFFLTIMIGIIAWAAVRITDKPAWLTIALAILGAASGPSFVVWRVYVQIIRRRKAIDASPPEGSSGATGGSS